MLQSAEIRKEGKQTLLVLTIAMQEPTPSSSGKTKVVATTHGNVPTSAQVDGKPVVVGVNAYIK